MEAVKYQQHPTLRLIKGGKVSKFQRCISATWQIAQSALWPDKVFSESDVKEFRTLIAIYYKGRADKTACLKQIIQRILLAKRYVSRNNGRYVSHPINWLNIHFSYGISGTKAWYKQIEEERKQVPHYNEGINLFANGVWKFLCQPTSENYHTLHEVLAEHEQYDLIEVLHHLIAIRQYGK